MCVPVSRSRVDPLIERVLQGEKSALARVISRIENREPQAVGLLHELFPHQRFVPRIGITGPPGAGKSTLVSQLVRVLRARELKVGVVAVDPTSPFSGGAVLGDRVRMSEVAMDPGVFIRSMATRGSLGGLAGTSREVCEALDAYGAERILLETVGVGQSELDVASAADTTVVVVVPESGDSIQALKAGLMEIADIFVINKADREGADRLAGDIESALGLKSWAGRWRPQVLQTVAVSGEGVDALREALDRHWEWLNQTGALGRRHREAVRGRILELTREAVTRAVLERAPRAELETLVDAVMSGEQSPYLAAERWAAELLKTAGTGRPPAGGA
ncbi:MAG: methylmalonyl Co-A mutase-associated GTPase MeaB [Candidatus Eisenbacteria bacterium]|nr:methylmalonyl Co-A mutase-associated GTPase MeaB [Candidatus Eisenbacteria bacterium]